MITKLVLVFLKTKSFKTKKLTTKSVKKTNSKKEKIFLFNIFIQYIEKILSKNNITICYKININ